MRVLILGGSVFVGRAIAAALVRTGCAVTTVNLDPLRALPSAAIEVLRADRNHGQEIAAAVRGRTWDLVIDTWKGPPEAVSVTAQLLRDTVSRYCYISSVTVYQPGVPPPFTESSLRLRAPYDSPDQYPARKAAAEDAVAVAFAERALVVRPGLIVGPWESVGRLPWWLLRLADYRQVLCPGPADRPVQWIDARDLADWLVHCAAVGLTGTYNLAGPPRSATMGSILEACRQVTGSQAELRWASESALARAGVSPWTELPLWIPPGHDEATAYDIDAALAERAGARFRPAQETIEDVWAWMCQLGRGRLAAFLERRPWLSRTREERILGAGSARMQLP